MKMPSGLVNLLGSRSTLLSGCTPPLHCKAVLRGNIMQNLVARFNGVLASQARRKQFTCGPASFKSERGANACVSKQN